MGLMLNRRRVMGGGEKLPQGAVRIEYLESTGTQRIETNIMVSQIVRYSTKMLMTNTNSAQAEGSTKGSCYFFVGVNGQNKIYCGLGSKIPAFNVSNDQTFHQFDLDTTTGYLSIDGVQTLYLQTGKIDSPIHFALFCCNGIVGNEGKFGYYITGKKAETQIYGDNGELLADFIPVRKGTTGYMYDKVSRQLFGNAGTGNFILGPDKGSAVRITQQQQHEMYGE